jgi:3-carboxy-cis,cis-muconate cycloisomerase
VIDLYWPGDARAEDLMTNRALVTALVRVELAWYAVLAEAEIAPRVELPPEPVLATISEKELAELSESAEAGGNPVIPLLVFLRSRLDRVSPGVSQWLHKGLTSQDTLDTALVLLLRDAFSRVLAEVSSQAQALRDLADRHRRTLAAARTLTQHAVPTTFGLTAAGWLQGVLDAADDLVQVRRSLPVQVGGAAGTLAAVTELAGSDSRAIALGEDLAERLKLQSSMPWQTSRRTLTRAADALVAATDAWGKIANDVLIRVRPEIGELSEGSAPGRGGSSTMPQKRNPVLSVLIHRAALAAPGLGAALHAAAAAAVDERPDGGWHVEWAPLRSLGRQTVIAGRQTTELVSTLVVHADRMRQTAEQAANELLAEQRSIRELRSAEPPPPELTQYLGATDPIIDAALERADRFVKELG